MEVTKREILFSIIILAVMMGLGLWLSNPIITHATQNANEVVSAAKITDAKQFGYIKRTNVGKFYAEGWLTVKTPVSIPDIEGCYGRIEKITEEYEQHTRIVTTTDSKGHTHTHTETYWEWDVKKREHWECDTAMFFNYGFRLSGLGFRYPMKYKETIKPKRGFFDDKIRYRYYVAPTKYYGTMTGIADNKSFSKLRFERGRTISDYVESAMSNIKGAPVAFWIFWTMLSISVTIFFCYFENKWLEDEPKNSAQSNEINNSWHDF